MHTIVGWEYFEKMRLYDIEIEPLLQSQYMWPSLLLLVVLSFSILHQPKSANENIDVPIVGSKQSWIARWRFLSDARKVLDEGYSKV